MKHPENLSFALRGWPFQEGFVVFYRLLSKQLRKQVLTSCQGNQKKNPLTACESRKKIATFSSKPAQTRA
jgi:hypothetical protein